MKTVQSPLISVVMPAYNAERFVKQAINSILAQTYSNFELLIADDKSTDNTRKIIESVSDPRIKLFPNDSNKGYLKTCNKLFALCTGDYITFQDADDLSHPQRLERLLHEFEKDPQLGMVGSGFDRQDENGNKFPGDSKTYRHHDILDLMPDKLPFAWAVFMFRKSVYESEGGYHEYFNRIGEEDYYWGGKIILKNKTSVLADVLYTYTVNPHSVSKSGGDIRKRYSGKIAKFLVRQQMETGTDSLSSGNANDLAILENECRMEAYFWERKKSAGTKQALKLFFMNPKKGLRYFRVALSYVLK